MILINLFLNRPEIRAKRVQWRRMKKFMEKPGEKERQIQYHKDRYKYDKEKAKEKTRKWRAANKTQVRAQNRRARYKLSDEQHFKMLLEQNHRCAICGGPPRVRTFLVVDHCHKTDKIRGLLCQPCNVGIGHLGEDVSRLEAAIAYLKKHST